uniref:MORN repeat-containing protein 3 n=1 Tax=Glossina brevipalpis TaxID=37001 RepID=A0A1A9X3Q7_9MUSC
MDRLCHCVCELKNYTKAESTGSRDRFFYPGGGNYKGYWLKSQHHGYGNKTNKNNLAYSGQWSNGKRHGMGSMTKTTPKGVTQLIYTGYWEDDKKCGGGKQFYGDAVYYGSWKNNRRHGLGLIFYESGDFYLGEWEVDVYHGLGVLFYDNGNRYEGHFARGYKNGEGLFYHMQTGQLQKGVWENGVCKSSIIQDEFRNQVVSPTPFCIPPICVAYPDQFVHDLFQKYLQNAKKPSKSPERLGALKFVQKMRRFAKFEPKNLSNSKIPLDDLNNICTTSIIYVILREL